MFVDLLIALLLLIVLSPVVSTHGAMSRWINHSWWTHRAIYCPSHFSMTSIIKAIWCAILSGGDVAYKTHIVVNRKEYPM